MKLIGTLTKLVGSCITMLCIATFLSQAVLLLTMWSRGMLTGEKVFRIQAVMAGVDYRQIRAETQAAARRTAEDPQRLAKNDVLVKQELALNRRTSDVALLESRLRETSRRIEVQDESFTSKISSMEAEALNITQRQLVQVMKNMAPEQMKNNMLTIIADGGIKDVLMVVRNLTNTEQAKVFSEFQSDEEKIILTELLQLMRQQPAR